MTRIIQRELIGLNTAQILATFFMPLGGEANGVIALVFKDHSGELSELSAGGSGELRLGQDPLGKLFFDKSLGYSCVAPLILMFEGALDGSEQIMDVLIDEMPNKTKIDLLLDNSLTLHLQLEDDELYVSLDNFSETRLT
ncbi:MAG TPA: hypothetical protein PKC09_02615 [Paracoccus sp. (in: a-proteobacteria)]|uniref:hypothetical protein n=1 Tax=uncultured Paracoccus sp. TaxID=189685 RepID=UPI001D75C3FC|nr:hypothetical protein [uncultured Paracoccus sp.]MCB1441183.1 hypothetical protein [Nitratireductor sp.]HMQ40143.1 hypothetical protein [Paracoccus sp. (in: a-proteobacteria)]HMR35115.1 hypothetical protein [Paracoccus sp. (in: a-proteobacteria)]